MVVTVFYVVSSHNPTVFDSLSCTSIFLNFIILLTFKL